MKSIRITALIGILTLGVCMSTSVQAKIFPYDYQTGSLENGLHYILIPMDTPELVSYYSVVRTGSRDEYEPGHSGFAHLFEHMMFRGTKNYPGDVYDKMITEIGADANAYTTDDYTCYHLNFTAQDLDTVMLLESDRFQNLDYAKQEFQTETGAVYGEYRKGRTNPWSVLFEEIYDLSYDVHTYQHTTIGFEEDVKAMPTMYAYSKSFFNRYYRPENVVILIVGDIDTSKTVSMLRNFYGNWKPGYVQPKIKPEPEQQEARSKEVTYNGRTLPILDVAYKGPAFSGTTKEYAALELLGDLAFGENSDLYKQLVIKEQKVQFIQPEFGMNRDPNLLHIFAMIKDKQDIPYVRDLINKTLEQYKSEPVDSQKLQDLQSRQRYGFLMNLNSPDHVAGNLARFIALTGGIKVVDQYYDTLSEITPQDIQQMADQYFVKTHRNVIILEGEQGS